MEKTSVKTNSCLILILGSLLLAGCGGGFKAVDIKSGPLLDRGISLGSTSPESGLSKVSSDEGSLEWNTLSNTAASVDVQFEMKVPFGRLHKLSSKIVKGLSPYACQFIPGINNSSPFSYNAGEIPCGGIQDANWKQLMVLPVEAQGGTSDGFTYFINGAQIPIWISRAQRSGSYTEASLDSASVETKTSSTNFGDDISVRYTPTGTQARFELCMNLPGTTVTSTPQTIEAKAWKKVLGVKVSNGSSFDVNPGQAVYDFARGCFAMDFGWQGTNLAPTVALTTTEAPHLVNATYSGLRLKINDWFLRLVDNIMGFFKSSLKDKVQKQAVKAANKILDQDIETGRWFTRIHGEETLESTATKMTKVISSAMNRVGIPASTTDLRTMIADSCRLKKLSLAKDWTARLETFCRDVVAKTELSIEPFAVDAASQSKGCYSHFGRIHESDSKWWSKECQISSRFKISIPLEFKDFQAELKTILASRFSKDRIPTDWQEAITELGLDEATVAIVLEELEKLGFNQISAGDLRARAMEIVSQLREKQAML